MYGRKTTRCHPQSIVFPQGFDVNYSYNHCSNEELAIQNVHEIILPYVYKIKAELGLPEVQKSLLIYKVLQGQTTKSYTDLLLENKIVYVCLCSTKFDPQVSTSRH